MTYANTDRLAFFRQDHNNSYVRGEKIDKMRHAAGQIFRYVDTIELTMYFGQWMQR